MVCNDFSIVITCPDFEKSNFSTECVLSSVNVELKCGFLESTKLIVPIQGHCMIGTIQSYKNTRKTFVNYFHGDLTRGSIISTFVLYRVAFCEIHTRKIPLSFSRKIVCGVFPRKEGYHKSIIKSTHHVFTIDSFAEDLAKFVQRLLHTS